MARTKKTTATSKTASAIRRSSRLKTSKSTRVPVAPKSASTATARTLRYIKRSKIIKNNAIKKTAIPKKRIATIGPQHPSYYKRWTFDKLVRRADELEIGLSYTERHAVFTTRPPIIRKLCALEKQMNLYVRCSVTELRKFIEQRKITLPDGRILKQGLINALQKADKQTTIPFIKEFPPELRNEVYHLVLEQQNCATRIPALIMTSRLLRSESLSIYHKMHHFKVSLAGAREHDKYHAPSRYAQLHFPRLRDGGINVHDIRYLHFTMPQKVVVSSATTVEKRIAISVDKRSGEVEYFVDKVKDTSLYVYYTTTSSGKSLQGDKPVLLRELEEVVKHAAECVRERGGLNLVEFQALGVAAWNVFQGAAF